MHYFGGFSIRPEGFLEQKKQFYAKISSMSPYFSTSIKIVQIEMAISEKSEIAIFLFVVKTYYALPCTIRFGFRQYIY